MSRNVEVSRMASLTNRHLIICSPLSEVIHGRVRSAFALNG
jgi:hypothetical protein